MPFIEEKSNEQSEFMPRTFKNKRIVNKVKRQARDAEYDAKAARLREESKQKKADRKNK